MHAHFLIWIKDWHKLLDNLGDASKREEFAAQLKVFAEKIASVKYNAKIDDMECKNSECKSKLGDNHKKCTNQDLRNLRCCKGTTSLGDKNILRCTKCNTNYTNEDIVKLGVDKILNWQTNGAIDESANPSLDNDTLWSTNTVASRRSVFMELRLMNSLIEQMKGNNKSIPKMGSSEYNEILFVTNTLRNIHKSKHTISCFKNNKYECRMKLPLKPSEEYNVLFEEKSKNWYDWKGNKTERNLFVLEQKRQFIDCFVNTYNEVASATIGCNTNVVPGVDGGSIIYCTLYVSKNEQEETKTNYARAANLVLKRLIDIRDHQDVEIQHINEENQQQLNDSINNMSNTNNNIRDTDEIQIDETRRNGLKAMISSVLQLTNSHKVSAPMAAYLVKNGSRFKYSHGFKWCNLKSFDQKDLQNFNLMTDSNDVPFLTNSVGDYLYRPDEFNDECYYDFSSTCTCICKEDDNSYEWAIPRSDRSNNIKVKKRKRFVIPCINHLDFINSKEFNEMSMDSGDVSLKDTDPKMIAMEHNAKRICLCFIPFRKLDDLKTDGKYLPTLRKFMAETKLTDQQQFVLRNIQECKNSLNAGRPDDPLEQVTNVPTVVAEEKKKNGLQELPLDSYMQNLVSNIDVVANPDDISYRNENETLSIDTSIITKGGSLKCGKEFVKTPIINEQDIHVNVINPQNTLNLQSNKSNKNRCPDGIQIRELGYDVLYELQNRRSEVINITSGTAYSGNITGTLENIKQYANLTFSGDRDQEHAFILTASAFVMGLYQKINPIKKRKRSEDKWYKQLLKYHNNNKQFVAFLSGAGGTGKSKVIHCIIDYCKQLFKNLGLQFNKRTIVVTALTGAAAVSINGETTAKACKLNNKNVSEDDEWEETIMIIVDEISFASKTIIENLNENLNILRGRPRHNKYGGLHVLFSGDFYQLKPINGSAIYLLKKLDLWYKVVHTYMELKTNHRFHTDSEHGRMLDKYRSGTFTIHDTTKYNKRCLVTPSNNTDGDLPDDIVIAVKDNLDRDAIHDAMFVKHLAKTHSKNKRYGVPKHTICILADNMEWKKKFREYSPMSQTGKDIIYATCSGHHNRSLNGNKCVDPMLKLFYDCTIMVIENIDVDKKMANGAVGKFKGVSLKDDCTVIDSVKTMLINEYHVQCISVNKIKCIHVELIEDLNEGDSARIVDIEPQEYYTKIKFPIDLYSKITHTTKRYRANMKLKQLPVNLATARTVHKLQGLSVNNVFISSWDYGGNWIYVVLSRCKTMRGMFFRRRLDHNKLKFIDDKVVQFYKKMDEKIYKENEMYTYM